MERSTVLTLAWKCSTAVFPKRLPGKDKPILGEKPVTTERQKAARANALIANGNDRAHRPVYFPPPSIPFQYSQWVLLATNHSIKRLPAVGVDKFPWTFLKSPHWQTTMLTLTFSAFRSLCGMRLGFRDAHAMLRAVLHQAESIQATRKMDSFRHFVQRLYN